LRTRPDNGNGTMCPGPGNGNLTGTHPSSAAIASTVSRICVRWIEFSA
jgi:hypothetical protein